MTAVGKALLNNQRIDRIPVWILKTYTIFGRGSVRYSSSQHVLITLNIFCGTSKDYFRVHPFPVEDIRTVLLTFLSATCSM
jgi:hypothetical protein